jgi:hypothetical protein
MKILYYYHDSCGLGDFYLLFPVFDALRRKHKNDEITLLSSDKIKDVVTNKNWFDNFISISGAEYPMNRFDKIYNWDIQKLGITIFYPPKKHFWEIAEKNYDITLDRNNFPDIFHLDLTSKEKEEVDLLLSDNKSKSIVLHTGHSYKFPYGKTPDYEWWYNITTEMSDCTFFQVGTKKLDPTSRIMPDFDIANSNVYDLRDELNLRQVAYLIEKTNTFVAIDSIVTHLSLHSNKTGVVIWGSSNINTHGHKHNINLESIRHCGKPPCIDLGGFIVEDTTNQNCCLMPGNAKADSWPLIEDVVYELNTLIE